MSEFKEFGKIARYNREIVITEKIDGTNGAIIIEENTLGTPELVDNQAYRTADGKYFVRAQSRNRVLELGKDNFGFAGWVARHRDVLALLGPGYHYGEWYGYGIQRGYGLSEKRFALFNVHRWLEDAEQSKTFKAIHEQLPQLEVVPLLYRGPRMETDEWMRGAADCDGAVDVSLDIIDMPTYWIKALKNTGSKAVPGFMNPEGVVIFHTASRQLYKVTCEKDEAAKGTYPGMHNQREEKHVA